MNTLQVARELVNVLEDKIGENIVLMDIQEIADFCDFFIVVSGTSDRMLTSLAESVLEKAKRDFNLPAKIEGQPSDGWLVVDLGDIVVHFFSPDQRNYYLLEQLWEQGKVLLRVQ